MNRVMRNTIFGVYDLVRHKLGRTTTEDCNRVENEEALYNRCSENKSADQMCGYRAADLRLCFRICKNRFSHDAAELNQNQCM